MRSLRSLPGLVQLLIVVALMLALAALGAAIGMSAGVATPFGIVTTGLVVGLYERLAVGRSLPAER